MSNLTLAVTDELIKRVRIRAIGEGTSVSAKVREFLALYADAVSPNVPLKTGQITAGGNFSAIVGSAEMPQSGTAANDLLRMMRDVRDEIAQNQSAQIDPVRVGADIGAGLGQAPVESKPARRTLRDDMYEGDFRARARIEGNALRVAGYNTESEGSSR